MRTLLALLLLASPVRAAPEPPPPSDEAPLSPHLIPPRLVRYFAPDYPEQPLAAGVESDVRCTLEIDETGAVDLADCEPGPPPSMVRAAEAALRRCQFTPGRIKGIKVVARYGIAVRFAVSGEKLDQPAPRALAPQPDWLEVQGEVLSQGVRAPVIGADVIAEGVGVAARTDGRGRFTLRLPPGSHLLLANTAGDLPAAGRVELSREAPVQVQLFLRPHEVTALSAVVPGDKERRAASRDSLAREELRNVPGSQDDPLRVVELLPGIARAPYTGGQLLVRGGNANDTGAYIDGQQVPQLYHLQNGPSVVAEEMVDRIDFLAGGAGAYYGRNISGDVSIVSRHGDPERWHGSAMVDLAKSSAFVQGPLDADTQLAAGARVSYSNPVLQAYSNENRSYTVPIYWDYQLRFDHRFGYRDTLTFTALGSHDAYQQVGNGRGEVPASLAQDLGFHRFRLAWEHKVGDDGRLTVAPIFGVDSSDSNEAGQGAAILALPQHDFERTTSSGGRAELSLKPRPDLDVRMGVDVLIDRVHYDIDQLFDLQLRNLGAPDAEEAVLRGVRVLGSVSEYAEAEWRAGSLRVTPGLRLEQLHYGRMTFGLFEPRIWARYSIDGATTPYAYAGVYHQAPLAEEIDPTIGNPRLLPLRADQYGLGIERKFGSVWTVKVEGFLNYRTSLVFPAAPYINSSGVIENPLQLNSGRGHAFGLELFIRHEFNARFYGWIAYTLSRSRETYGPGQAWLPTPYDQPQVFNFLLGLRIHPLVEFAVRLRIASGNPLAPVVSSAYDADSGAYVPVLGPFGSARLPTFAQLDFEVNSVWLANLLQVSLYVDFENILNRDNPELVLYDYRYEQSQTEESTPFQVLIGLKAAF